MSYLEKIDFSKCTRVQVQPCPNFFNLDIILQDGFPISIVQNDFSDPINPIEHDNEYFDIIRQDFKIEDANVNLYNISSDTCMIIKPNGTSEIYSKNPETDKIYHPTKKEVDLEISQADIEKSRLAIETTLINNEIENKKGITSLFNEFKNFIKRPFLSKTPRLSASTTNSPTNKSNTEISHLANTRNSFTRGLNPDNPIYDHDTVIPLENLEHSIEKTIDIETEFDN